MRWRLLSLAEGRSGEGPTGLSGPLNMGLDEALLRSAVETGVPCLRFYTWDGPWLSVGYAQPLRDGRLAALEASGVGFVRRVTGGKAVLHGADLTYSVAAPEGVLPGGVRESYEAIADALLEALSSVGVAATRSAPGSRAPGPGVFDCFEAPAADEICLGGQKLSGSAQRRVLGGFLQHGSIRLRPDPAPAVAAVAPDGRSLGGTSLEEAGQGIRAGELAEACRRAFAGRFGAQLEPSSPSDAEREQAHRRGVEPLPVSHLRDAPSRRIPANP